MVASGVTDDRARRELSKVPLLARQFPLPSFLSARRSRVVTAAAAVTVAAGLSAAALTLPASFSSAPAAASGVAAARLAADGHDLAVAGQQPPVAAHARYALGQQAAGVKAAGASAATAAQHPVAQHPVAHHPVAHHPVAHHLVAHHPVAHHPAAQPAAARHPATGSKRPAQPAQQDASTVPSGSPQQIAKAMLSTFGWQASQFSCLEPLWYHESGWNQSAENPSSGAYGIPQALPGAQMASAGADWKTSASTQIRWGLTYIHGRYGSPCGAWAHEQADNWY
jgi:hypothetical protein